MIPKQLMKIFPVMLGLALVATIACGSAPAAPEPTAPPAADPAPADPAAQPTPIPVAEATPTPVPPAAATPTGTLNVGQMELGSFAGYPTQSVAPGQGSTNAASIGEGLMRLDINWEIKGRLLEFWSISDDFLTWTFKIQEGVQFHKGYGEMTTEDVVWSFVEGWTLNERHARQAQFREFWAHPEGSVETPDDYTVVVNTGEPLPAAVIQDAWMASVIGGDHWVASKQQTEEIGAEAANLDPALTGPWEMIEHRPSQFWRMRAVENHWRQTPYFEELIFWEIPEEASRLAGFQTGQLDTFNMSFDSMPLVEGVQGARIMRVPGEGAEYTLRFYGNYHVEALTGEPRDSYNPEMPWISASADLDSEEWRRTLKVRQAMVMAIERETIIETILGGFARHGLLQGYSNNEHLLGDRRWEYNPDRARELLAEAGYGDGFSITLTPGTVTAAPGVVELCEAVGTMWSNELGLDVHFQRIPFAALRPQMVGRTYQGAMCFAASQRLVVGGERNLTALGVNSFGATHPFLEDLIPRINQTVADAERERLEAEQGAFLFDNALTTIGLAVGDAVWPVGPRIEEWAEHVRVRVPMNGYEYIRPRQ